MDCVGVGTTNTKGGKPMIYDISLKYVTDSEGLMAVERIAHGSRLLRGEWGSIGSVSAPLQVAFCQDGTTGGRIVYVYLVDVRQSRPTEVARGYCSLSDARAWAGAWYDEITQTLQAGATWQIATLTPPAKPRQESKLSVESLMAKIEAAQAKLAILKERQNAVLGDG